MAELQDIDGVGPAREESLVEAGYESVEALAGADHEQLAEDADIPDDTALEFVVQAENLTADDEEDDGEEFDLTPQDLSNEREEQESEEEEEVAEEPEVEEEEENDAESEDDGDEESEDEESYLIEIEFEERLEYDTFHDALMSRWCDVYTSRQPAADALRKCLDELDSHESVEYLLTADELNNLHSAVLQKRTEYQGDNLIDQMDALEKVEQQVNELRDKHLF